jgi:hypothetical protein
VTEVGCETVVSGLGVRCIAELPVTCCREFHGLHKSGAPIALISFAER